MTTGPGAPFHYLHLWKWPLLSLLCAIGMWTYANRILVPYQKSDAVAHERPRGNLSDLYPRWLGAKELLMYGRDPYSPEVTREIQAGYYGRVLDPSRLNDPRDEEGFAYPVYVVFWLAPTIGLPFTIVQQSFFWAMMVLICTSTLLWIRILRWDISIWTQISFLVLTLGSLPVMQGLKLQQMSLLVAGVLAIALILLVTDHLVASGVLLATATIKPQLVLLLLLWLAIWTLSDWRRRFPLAASFLATMTALIATSEWYLPHWIPRFWHAVHEYQRYTAAKSVIGVLVGSSWGHFGELLAFAVFLSICWRERRHALSSSAFAFMLSLALLTTVLIAPMYGPYNQVLLIPGVLVLVKDRRAIWQRGVINRLLLSLAAGIVLWPWISSTLLALLSYIFPQESIEQAWAIPFWTVIQIPVAVTGVMLLHYYQRTFTPSSEPGSS